MANDINWGQGAINNNIGWGQGAKNNSIGWGSSQFTSAAGETEIYGLRQDADVTAFLSATAITDTTTQSAIDTLVFDLKSYGLWSKMKAIYPFVGGTATTHKFNLVNPADTNGAFRLSFNGGWTHSSNGVLPNGTNGYADTYIVANGNLGLNSTHLSIYSRTNTDISAPSIANSTGAFASETSLWLKSTNLLYVRINSNIVGSLDNTNSTGYYIGSRNSSTQVSVFKNNTKTTFNQNSNALGFISYKIGGINTFFDNKQLAFATIGDGLTDEDSANLYYSVQKFQTTLGRQVGTPIYSSNATDVNARLFLGATNIQDATITSAVDTLVQGLKTDGIWSKLKAVYPFVGGTATTHKFNLANALDEDASFRLAFSGGITHDANGVTPNGVNAFANTFFNPRTSLTIGSNSQGHYQRLNQTDSGFRGVWDNTTAYRLEISTNATPYAVRCKTIANGTTIEIAAIADTTGLILSKSNSGLFRWYKNTTLLGSTSAGSTIYPNIPYYLFANNNNGTAAFFSNMPLSFSFLGDGLSDTEASNLYTRVQAFQTSLSRAVI